MCCGLEDNITSLNQPQFLQTSDGDKYFKLKITNSNNEEELRGLEFYYKFYDYSIPLSSLELNFETKDELVASNFKRLSSSTDSLNNFNKPLIPVFTTDYDLDGQNYNFDYRGGEYIFTIDFSDMDDPYIYISPIDSEYGLTFDHFSIYREVVYTSGVNENECKPFNDMKNDDSDFSHITQLLNNNDEIYIVLYALTFGRYNVFTPIYSKAVCLEYIKLSFTEDS
jgi:hypothetical protein